METVFAERAESFVLGALANYATLRTRCSRDSFGFCHLLFLQLGVWRMSLKIMLGDSVGQRARRRAIAALIVVGSLPFGGAAASADDVGNDVDDQAAPAAAADPTQQAAVMSDAEVEALLRRGRTVAPLAVVTFGGRVVNDSGSLISGASVSAMRWEDDNCMGTPGTPAPDSCFAFSDAADGTFSLRFDDGLWGVRIEPPANSSFSKREFLVSVDGSSVVALNPDESFICGGTAAACSSSTAFTLPTANFTAVVVDGDGNPVEQAWVELEQWVGTDAGYPWMHNGMGMESGVAEYDQVPGQVTLALSEATFYKIRLNKPWNGTADVADTTLYLKVNLSGSGAISSVETCTWTDGGPQSSEPECAGSLAKSGSRYVLQFDVPNFRVRVCAPGTGTSCTPVPAWFSIELCVEDEFYGQMCSHAGGASVGEDGLAGVALAESGLYRFRLEPSWDYTGAPLATTVITADITVSGAGAVTAVDGLSSASGAYLLRFKAPNVAGTLKFPDDGSELAGQPVAWSWIEPLVWSDEWQRYDWSNEIQGGNTNEDGEFALSLPEGDYKLRFQASEGYADRSIYVHVASASVACIGRTEANPDTGMGGASSVRPVANGSCASAQTFNVTLATPNVSGVILAGTEPQAWSHVQVEKWNGNWWDWAGMNVNSDYEGRFAALIEEAGVYRFRFEPGWDQTDYASTNRYVVACGSASITLAYATSADVATAWDCASPTTAMTTRLTSNVSLLGANFVGRVTYGGQGLGDVWIDIADCTTNEWCDHEGGVNTRRVWGAQNSEDQGRFGTSLLDKDTSDTAATEYQVNVNPPHNSSIGVVRQTFRVYAYSGWGDGRQVCVGEANFDDSGNEPTCTSDALYGESRAITIAMTTGNMPGRLVIPDAGCAAVTSDACPGIGDGWIEVQQWVPLPWNNSEYGWDWTDLGGNSNGGWGNADRRGSFNIDLPGSSDADAPALYKITGNPSWNNPDGYAKRSVVVYVDGDDNWCVQEGTPSEGARNLAKPYATLCSPTGANDNVPSDAVEGMTLELVGANLKGTMYTPGGAESGEPVGDAHIGLERITEEVWCTDDDRNNAPEADKDENGNPYWCVGEWYEWLGGSNTAQFGSNKGAFALSIVEPGDYRLRVEMPWNWSNPEVELAPFNVDFTVEETSACAVGNTDPENCDVSGINVKGFTPVPDTALYAGEYPLPTISGTLYDKGGTAVVGGGWISVHDADTGEWVTGSGTVWNGARKGRFAVSLDAGTYNVEFHPNWENRDAGVRNVVSNVVVTADGIIDPAFDYDGGCPEGTSTTDQDTCLRSPAIDGPVLYRADDCDDADCAEPMPWAHAEALSCTSTTISRADCQTWVDWGNTEDDGVLKMALDDGSYLLRVFPNWDLKQTREMELEVVVAGGVMTECAYGFGGECRDADGAFSADFDAVPPNVFIRVEGVGGHPVDSSRYVIIESCDASDCSGTNEELGRYLARYSTSESKPRLDLYLSFGDDDHTDNNGVVSVSEYYRVTLLSLDGVDDPNPNAPDSVKQIIVTAPKVKPTDPTATSHLTTLKAAAGNT